MSESEVKLPRSKLIGLFIGIDLALFLSALDQTILNTAIPKISTALGDIDRGAWIITSYLFACTLVTPVAGKLADIIGTKRALILATIVFALLSISCGLSHSLLMLIIARALQGLGGGAMISLCFISVGDLFAARDRGKYQGLLAAAFIIAALIGPPLGGWLADANQWPMIFFLNVPLGILAAVCLAAFFPQTKRELAKDADPIIPLHLFKSKLIAICLTTVFVSGIGLFGGSLVLAGLLQQIFHTSAAESGYALVPLTLIVAASSVVSGLLVSKTGRYKNICIVGLLLMCTGSMLLATLTAKSNMPTVLAGAGISGIGLGALLPVHAIVVQNAVEGSVLGFATSMTQLFRSLGGTIGTGLMSALLVLLMKTHTMPESFAILFVVYAITVAATVVLNFFLPEVELKKAKA